MPITELSFKSWDGTELFYRAWLPAQPAAKSILLFHRGHEHSARWQETVDSLALTDVAIFAWDQRGHGRSPGERGSAPSVTALAKDADYFTRHLQIVHGITLESTAVIASSLGAVVATTWVHDFGPPICSMVLAAPAFRVKLYVPFAILGLRVLSKVFPNLKIKSYVKSKMLTHDARAAAAYDADPLIFREISVGTLLDLHDTSTRILSDAEAIRVPTLLLIAGKDWVVKLTAQKSFFQSLGSPIKQMEVYPSDYHSLFQESNRQQIVDRTKEFIAGFFDRKSDHCSLIHADQGGFTRTEYDQLRAPGSLHWPIVKVGLKAIGPLSQGISLGEKSGFDSGQTLDYVYENKPRGVTPLGKLIDYVYLNAVGWRGIRIRGENLRRMLRATIDKLHQTGRPIQILDIASGPGRYVLETLKNTSEISARTTLRDYRQTNLDAARQLIDQLQLSNVTTQLADAFDRESLANVMPRPTIAIASGLYELFPENPPVLRSLQGIADAMDEGGYLLYTCQPWHPQVEFIARVLTNREGNPWIMRRRTQAEMDALVRAAGFEKIEQDIDPWGIFTVSLARRVSQSRQNPLDISPSPGTPGKGRCEGDFDRRTIPGTRNHPLPERGPEGNNPNDLTTVSP
jgi:alpha-beta hydrolase superfamily lysophospholipase/SAM-dependent methyltransferase